MSTSIPAASPPARTAFQRYRVLVLPFAAAVIAGLVIWRMQQEQRSRAQQSSAGQSPQMMAPSFVLTDNHRHMVKLSGYLGRTKLILVFFDGSKPAHDNPIVAWLRDNHDALKKLDVQPLAVSTASPFAVEKSEELAGKKFPFPILMDVDPAGYMPTPAHQQWGLTIEGQPEMLRTGLFLIDRMGRVQSWQGRPLAISQPDKTLAEILHGDWPVEPLPKVHKEQTVDPSTLPGL
jgi:peroxiredoxin